jgi:hypothetical protein
VDQRPLEWLGELAVHLGWVGSLGEFWDDRPNVGRLVRGRPAGTLHHGGVRAGTRLDAPLVWRAPDDLGITVPVLEALIEAYGERRRRELSDLGSVMALAVNDPKGLRQLEAPDPSEEQPAGSEFERPIWSG